MNKKTYIGIDIEVVLFPRADVVTASSYTQEDGETGIYSVNRINDFLTS